MSTYLFWEVLPSEIQLDQSLVLAFEKLEDAGWHARGMWGNHSVRFWPDGNRPKQFTVDLRYPLNEHRIVYLERHTGVQLSNERKTE